MVKKQLVILTRNLVKPGRPLLCPVYKADGTLLAQKGIVLTEEQVAILDDYPQLYTLGKALSAAISPSRFSQDRDESEHYKWRSPFVRLEELRNELIRVLQDPLNGDNLECIDAIIRRLEVIVGEAPDAALATIVMDQQEHYAAQHAIHVAILCLLTVDFLGWDARHRHALLAAALTMNLSLGLLQNDLQEQKQRLSPQQERIIRRHPEASRALLEEMGVDDRNWLDYVEMHHESIDGTGYPKGLVGHEIRLGASLLQLADVYCAKVTGRSYRDPLAPPVAARTIFLGQGQKKRLDITEVLLKVVGLYPPGCQVLLENGEIAIVIKRGTRVDAPHVRSIVDPQGRRYQASILRNTANRAFAIKRVVEPHVLKYDPEFARLWGYDPME